MKRVGTAFLVLVLFVVLPATAQMGGGMMSGTMGPGQTNGMTAGANGSMMPGTGDMFNGTMSAAGAMAGMGGMGTMDELTIGPDGTAYVLDLDSSDTSALKTTVTAISPLTTLASQWKVSLPGVARAFAAGTDRLVLSTVVQTAATQTTPASFKSTLYILSVASGAQAFALNHDGVATSLKIVKVNGVDLAYLVTHAANTTTAASPTTKLTIYRLDTGAVVKGVTVANDIDVLTEQ